MKNPSYYNITIVCDQPSDDLFLDLGEIIFKRQKLYPRSKRIGYYASGYNLKEKEYWFCIKTRCIKPCLRQVIEKMKGLNIKKIDYKRLTHDRMRERKN